MSLQGKAATIEVPTTQAELSALQIRRSELNDQLRSVSDTRSQLVGERFNAQANQNQAVVAELDARIKSLGERIARLETEKLAADDAIAAGISRVAQTEGVVVLPPPDISTPVINIPGVPPFELDNSNRGPEREVAVFGSMALVALALIAWRWASGRSRDARRVKELSAESQSTKDLRVAVETIAVEVERISENQRFITKLLSERPQADPALLRKTVE